MGQASQNADMSILIVFVVLLAGCVLSVVLGNDRDLDDRDRRSWWPGDKRR
jgi:hypothetical protein